MAELVELLLDKEFWASLEQIVVHVGLILALLSRHFHKKALDTTTEAVEMVEAEDVKARVASKASGVTAKVLNGSKTRAELIRSKLLNGRAEDR